MDQNLPAEPQTEWICKGKAGVRQELGVKVCIVEDQFGFILNHRIMNGEQDKDIAFEMTRSTQEKFPALRSISFDKGFYFSVPTEMFYTKYRTGDLSFGLHPLTKDGAATLFNHNALFGLLGDTEFSSIKRDWRDILD